MIGERLKDFDLGAGVSHMIFAANNVRNFLVNIIYHTRQCIEEGAIAAYQDRVGKRTCIYALLPAHHIIPCHSLARQLKPPMRLTAFGLKRRLLLVRQIKTGTVIDGRLALHAL